MTAKKPDALDHPDQLGRYEGTISIDLWYPGVGSNATHIEVGLCAVRAADSIRIHYDLDRDGYVVEQPKRTRVLVEKGSTIDTYEERTEWIEAAFLPAWPYDPGDGAT